LTLTALRAHTELQMESANEQRSALQSSATAAQQTAEAEDLRELAAIYDERVETARQALQAIEPAANLVNRWTLEVEEEAKEEPGARRLSQWISLVRGAAQRAWNFELIAVEDTSRSRAKPSPASAA